MIPLINHSMKTVRGIRVGVRLLSCPATHRLSGVGLLFHSPVAPHTLELTSLTRCTPYTLHPGLFPRGSVCNYTTEMDSARYEQVSDETLDSLSEMLEELIESDASLSDSDVLFSSGVLTLQLGASGTYVINKQVPNKQIWFSSPHSGPKRFDFQDQTWIYKHTGETLHGVLEEELSQIFHTQIDLSACLYARTASQ
ncbi:hypothetical protein Pmani_004375 [Petrolisthes manimaculis]|uniref:ferroxidase n=1 Tax=Petrolisthes manimaculis TaxID=1843537 RepID=A0AAE1QGI3_9EUCA|nr:hypothetical protein Pmani_004375 [Petrolisthes manimaculis]